MGTHKPQQKMSVIIPSPTETERFHDISFPSSNSSSPLSSAPSSPVFPVTPPPRVKQEPESDYERSRHLSRRVAVERAKFVPCRITRNTPSKSGLWSPLTPISKRERGSNRQGPTPCSQQTESGFKPRRTRRSTVGPSSGPILYSLSDTGPLYATPLDTPDESDYGRSHHLSPLTKPIPTAAASRPLRYSDNSDSSPLSSAPSSPVFPSLPTQDDIKREKKPPAAQPKPSPRKRKKSDPNSGPAKKPKHPTVSPYFPTTPKKRAPKTGPISCIPFPPLSSPTFGLVQESLQHSPFRLLIAVIFLNKTRGAVAMPVYHALMSRYPTTKDLAEAKLEDVVGFFQHLGLQNQRARKCVALAKAWLADPPKKGRRYRRLHYPNRGNGKDIPTGHGPIFDEDERVAWEVGHLPGIGAYAIDSWRIFCRDRLRGLPSELPPLEELATEEQRQEEMKGEWARVLPGDKELRAYLRWRWLRVGWVWDPISGERKAASTEEIERIERGGVVIEEDGGSAEVLGGHEAGIKKEVDAEHGDGNAEEPKDEDMPDAVDGQSEKEEEWMFTPSSWQLRTSGEADA